ncbi:NYN domain-containing protein [Cellulomonas sp.]|uniref:NYN domain-containing protein n=1 Tax=Cellulomonas sp. TaxID=40001 RepID=UPI003BACB0DE
MNGTQIGWSPFPPAGPRTLFIYDIENVIGAGAHITAAQVGRAQARLNAAVPVRPGDHTVIACNGANAAAVHLSWAGSADRRVRSGRDGADAALLEAIDDAKWVAARYKRVVIATGDGGFAEAVASLKAAGCTVVVIAPDVGLSKRMRLAAGPHLVQLGSSVPVSSIHMHESTREVA